MAKAEILLLKVYSPPPLLNGMWLRCGYEAAALRDLTERGRGKIRNIMIIGPADCGKTFLLAPLQIVFKTFSNPEKDKFAWIGAGTSECIFLNDFRWSGELNNLESFYFF